MSSRHFLDNNNTLFRHFPDIIHKYSRQLSDNALPLHLADKQKYNIQHFLDTSPFLDNPDTTGNSLTIIQTALNNMDD